MSSSDCPVDVDTLDMLRELADEDNPEFFEELMESYVGDAQNLAANLEKGPDNLLTFRGSKVFETRPFDIDFIGEPRDLLVRERQIGEYFVFPNDDEVGGADEQRDGTSNRDIFIYSMDDDDFVRMRYSECLAAAKRNFRTLQVSP